MIASNRVLAGLGAAALVLAGCTPPGGPRGADAGLPLPGSGEDTLVAPAPRSVGAGQSARFGAIASIVLAPTAAASAVGRGGEDDGSSSGSEASGDAEEPTVVFPATGLRLRTAHVEVSDPLPSGERLVRLESVLEDARGARLRETRTGVLGDRPDGRRSFRWTGPPAVEPVTP